MLKRNQKKKSGARIGNVGIVKPINRARTLGGGRHRSHKEQQQAQVCLRPLMRTFLQGTCGIPNIYKSQSQRKQSARKAGNRSGTNHDTQEKMRCKGVSGACQMQMAQQSSSIRRNEQIEVSSTRKNRQQRNSYLCPAFLEG